MTRIAMLGGLVAAAVAGGLGVWGLQHTKAAHAQHGQERASLSAVNPATAEELQQLQARLAMMELRAAANERSVFDLANAHEASKPAESAQVPPPQAPPSDPAAELQAAKEFAAKEAGRWEDAFTQEAKDQNWARASEGQLLQMTRNAFADVLVKDLECRSQTCRFTADVGAGSPQQAQLLAFKLQESFPVVHFHHSDTPGQERYFVTKGEAPQADAD